MHFCGDNVLRVVIPYIISTGHSIIQFGIIDNQVRAVGLAGEAERYISKE